MNRVLFNFAEAAAAASWQPINDSVMGGVSVSPSASTRPAMRCSKGAFLRAQRGLRLGALLPAAGICHRACGRAADRGARRWQGLASFNLRTDDGFDGVNYQTRFRPLQVPGTAVVWQWPTSNLPGEGVPCPMRRRLPHSAAPGRSDDRGSPGGAVQACRSLH